MPKIVKFLNEIIRNIVSFSVFLILVVICLQVFFRFVLNDALSWPEEASRFLMIWALFLGGAYAYLDGEHVGITYFSDKFSKKVSILNNILVNGAIIIFLIALMYGGWQETNMLKTFNTGALGISRAIPYAAIPVSAALYIIFSIIIISNSIRMRLK